MRDEDRYLQQRGERWHYVRRVPTSIADLDQRCFVRRSLKTRSLEVARRRRDDHEAADDLYWASLITDTDAEAAEARYESAVRRALALNLSYVPAQDLALKAVASELVHRVDTAWRKDGPSEPRVEAALGGVEQPSVKIGDALDLYFRKISRDEVKHKSPGQIKSWQKAKRRAINRFISTAGDKAMDEIDRSDAQKLYEALLDRVAPEEGEPTLSGHAAKRDFGNVRKLFRDYFRWIGDSDRENPFRDLSFKDVQITEVQPFEPKWICDHILKPDAFGGLNREAKLIVYTLIETGARPSEIANLETDAIKLDCDVPHLDIAPSRSREIKNSASRRQIPLVGVSLAAFEASPEGFPRYRDKENSLSACLMQCFRRNELFPTKAHRIYSFRHSFEKRMAEAGIDYGLRCLLMGHTTSRPVYGDGGSLEYKRDQLMKVALPYPADLL